MNLQRRIEAVEKELSDRNIAAHGAVIKRVFAQFADEELEKVAARDTNPWETLTDAEVQAIADGGPAPADFVIVPMPTWYWKRVRELTTPEEYRALRQVA